MKSLFLVSSAVYTPYGIYTTSQRIRQTKETISSIKKHAYNSDIILLDFGKRSIEMDDDSIEIINFSQENNNIKKIIQYLESGTLKCPEHVIKSLLEINMFRKYFYFLYKNNYHLRYNRIFKISGRYKLNDNFNYFSHLEAKDKVLILNPCISQYAYNPSANLGLFSQYMTRLWSFDSSILFDICRTYDKMEKNILEMIENKSVGDIEHFLYKNLNKNLVSHIDKIGIEGFIASSGELIVE